MERSEKVANFIKELAAKFLGKENNRTSLVTVTGCTTSPDLKRATIFFTVFPESKEHDALDFAKRKRGEFRDYLKENFKGKIVPFIDFEIDQGEKNRQKIDDLLRQK